MLVRRVVTAIILVPPTFVFVLTGLQHVTKETGTVVTIEHPTPTTCQMVVEPDHGSRHRTIVYPRDVCDRFYLGQNYALHLDDQIVPTHP
ncbi:MAG TPA: hypothetical protein VMT30_07070 [Candidatus Saccharimonadia bacterium]|nr:hypothetical protein [Candidatus Saccharimonadia bacterium]